MAKKDDKDKDKKKAEAARKAAARKAAAKGRGKPVKTPPTTKTIAGKKKAKAASVITKRTRGR